MFIDDALLQGDDIDRIIPASPPSLIKKFGIECEYGRAQHGNKREEGAYGKEKPATVGSFRASDCRRGSDHLISIFYSREFAYYVNVTVGICHTAHNPPSEDRKSVV